MDTGIIVPLATRKCGGEFNRLDLRQGHHRLVKIRTFAPARGIEVGKLETILILGINAIKHILIEAHHELMDVVIAIYLRIK